MTLFIGNEEVEKLLTMQTTIARYFYKPQPLRTLEQIRADILALEKETEGLLDEIVREAGTT